MPNEIHSLAFSKDGDVLYYAQGSSACRIEALRVESGESTLVRALPFCPKRLQTFEDGSLLAAGADQSLWIGPDGSNRFEGRTILAAESATRFLEKDGTRLLWREGETSLALEPVSIRAPRVANGGALLAIRSSDGDEQIVRFDGPTSTPITPAFESIDSYDIAPRGEEVVFSALVESGFDVGIVSVSGGEISWVAPEPADELNVTWAPRGNKITYAFESVDATLVRSVHVPSSFQVILDLPLAAVRNVAWEPKAERIALVIESAASGPGIDWVGYNGEGRANLVSPKERIETPIEIAIWSGGSGVLLGPSTIRYGETMPMVIWIDSRDALAYRPAVARIREAGLPVLVTEPGRLGDLAQATDELPWVSVSSLYVVDVAGLGSDVATVFETATWFVRTESSDDQRREIVISGSDEGFRAAVARRIVEDAKVNDGVE